MHPMLKRIAALRAKKDILQAKIEQEASRPQPDSVRLQLLKRQRLRLKDQIAHASRITFISAGTDRLARHQLTRAG